MVDDRVVTDSRVEILILKENNRIFLHIFTDRRAQNLETLNANFSLDLDILGRKDFISVWFYDIDC